MNGENFLVPLDFDETINLKLIKLQDVIDRIAELGESQIILMDACRSNFEAQNILLTKSIYSGQEKAIYVGDSVERLSGLAEMRAARGTLSHLRHPRAMWLMRARRN